MQAFNFALDRLTNASLRCRWMWLVMLALLGCICAVGFSYAEEPVAAQHAVAVQESVAEQEPAERSAAGASYRRDDRRDGSLHRDFAAGAWILVPLPARSIASPWRSRIQPMIRAITSASPFDSS